MVQLALDFTFFLLLAEKKNIQEPWWNIEGTEIVSADGVKVCKDRSS